MEKSGSYVNQIVAAVKKMIINKELKVGDRLPTEPELSKKFNKSRGCVREAIKILESYGILEVRQGDGTYVCASAGAGMFDALFFQIISQGSDFVELQSLREILEVGIIKQAISAATESDIERICLVENELHQAIEENKELEILVDLDMKFHRTITEITKNRVLQEVYRNLIEIFRPYILNSFEQQSYENHFSVLLHHELFIQAIREKDHHLGYIAVKYSMNDWSRLQGIMEDSANI